MLRQPIALFALFVLVAPVCCRGISAASAEPLSTETSVRAAFIVNFSKFVSFPTTALPQHLCVIGSDAQLLTAINEV